MVTRHYDWGKAKIGYHSVVKHKILSDYIRAYVSTLTKNIGIDHFRLALVDGFAGGGQYEADWNGSTVYGSPITMLEACEQARIEAQSIRTKPFKLDAKFYFVEKKKAAHAHLIKTLTDRDYSSRVNSNQDIALFHGDFLNSCDRIISDIKLNSPSARSIFLLDQYGYSRVPKSTIRKIFTELPGAEIILTFNVDSLLNYLNKDNLLDFHRKTGFNIDTLLDSNYHDKDTRPEDWRLAAQAILHSGLVADCFPDGTGHHTTFYIRALGGHGDYWLVHLSRNLTARNVMVDIHWLHGNHFVHYGGSGLDMYCLRGFNVKADADMFGFDIDAKVATENALQEQLPRLITDKYSGGITYHKLLTDQANYTPARDRDIREVFQNEDIRRDIMIVSETGTVRRIGTAPKNSDIIIPNPQKRFIF